MITLREIMDNLTYGELSHVSIGGGAMGFIDDKDFPKIVSCLNGALTALHKRFLLRTGEVFIQQYADIQTYYLRPEYAVSDETLGKTKYLLDSVDEPFPKNVFKIEQFINADGYALILNDSSISIVRTVSVNGVVIQDSPIYTPNFDTLVMTPDPEALQIVKVQYRADHPRIKVTTGFDPDLIELHIPTSILDAISLGVATRIYSPLTGGDGDKSAAAAFSYQYELECKRLEAENIAIDPALTEDTRFESQGFV